MTNELYGIKIVIDNRVKYGSFLPLRGTHDTLRCSKETFKVLEKSKTKPTFNMDLTRMSDIYAIRILNMPPEQQRLYGITA